MHPLQDTWMGLFIDDVLRSRLVQVGMRLQLKKQIQDVDEEQYDSSTPTDFQDSSIGSVGVTERGMESRLVPVCYEKRLPGR